MAEIKPTNQEIIREKLQKIRCCTGCLNRINYLVFGHGLYCAECLSKLPEITNDHFIQLNALAALLVELTDQYAQRSKSQTCQLNIFKGQINTLKTDIKKCKQILTHDSRTVKQKSLATIDELFSECLKQNQNQSLQAFYEPDITASLILNESQLLLRNLNNLSIEQIDGNVTYTFKQGFKDAAKINKKIERSYKQLSDQIESATLQCHGVIANFIKQINRT